MANMNQLRPNLLRTRGRDLKSGNTLAFVLIFLTMLSFLIIPIMNYFNQSVITTIKSKNALIALNLAVQTLEELKAKDFADVATMLPSDYRSYSGEWLSGGAEKINYPDYYKMFSYNVNVVAGKQLKQPNDNLKQVLVTVRWEELNDERRRLKHEIKLVSMLSREAPGE